MPSGDGLRVEVVFALPERQVLLALSMPRGATVQQAIDRSAIAEKFPGWDLDRCAVGIWGQPVARARPVGDGDRIEIYRELAIEPREARRRLAGAGRTMAPRRSPHRGR